MPGLVSSARVPLNQEPNHGQQSLFIMHKDWSFPNQLYPHFYLDGPPEVKPKHSYGGWGSYERVLAVNAGPCNGEESIDDPTFESQHTQQGEQWVQLKASVTPLMPACLGAKVLSSELVDPLGFPEQMQYYYQHYCLDAFPTMGHLLQESFTFKHKKSKDVISVPWALNVIHGLRFKSCGLVNVSRKVRHMHHLLSDLVSDVPPSLLASLLSEELSSHRERQQFCPGTSGGALGYMPFLESQMGGTGCLIYPTGAAMDKLFILSLGW
ncbi:hypothetical protein DNTS_004648 [Danionella cerebrum]|uniref:Uncharacterized protein n=1 Tax=Danionella cerebrum TaxID=2873325 RepID=A0A553QYC7_9TELE|nr:hypothetical protein DNTS_004648 [Danionella translucida]